MKGTLVRSYLRSCTPGLLQFGPIELATIERPWIPHPDGPGGVRRESCIGEGTYQVRPWNSEKFPDTYILINNALSVYEQPMLIPPGQTFGRSAILIHIGNSVADVIGCIAVGLHHSGDHLMVADSRIAMSRLREVLGRESHQLTIRPATAEELPS